MAGFDLAHVESAFGPGALPTARTDREVALTAADIDRLVRAGARLHVSVTAEDGTDVVDRDVTARGVYHVHPGQAVLVAVDAEGRESRVPVTVARDAEPAAVGGAR